MIKERYLSDGLAYKDLLVELPRAIDLIVSSHSNDIDLPQPPEIKIYCKECKSSTLHIGKKCSIDCWDKIKGWKQWNKEKSYHRILLFVCKQCEECIFMYFDCIDEFLDKDEEIENKRYIRKIGQYPSNVDISENIIAFLKSNTYIDFYKNAIEAENTGKGIGAMAYWRRIIEGKFKDLIVAIISVLDPVADREIIKKLKEDNENWQFSQSVENITLPSSWFIYGNNPLILVHNATSEGIHKLDDWECLEKAKHIRSIVNFLLEKIFSIKEQAPILKEAVKQLANRKSK